VVAAYQMSYAGLLVGDGTAYELNQIEGLADMPDLRTSDRTRLRRHGELPGDDFLEGRSIVLTLEVFGADDTAFQAAIDALKAAFTPGNPETALTLQVPGIAGGGQRRLNVRPRKLALPVDVDRFFYRQPIVAIQLDATDPRIYDDALQSVATSLAATPTGHTWNNTWNLSWGTAGVSGSIFALNAGTFPTLPAFRIDGPVVNPSIENITDGLTLAFNITLGSGEFLDVDSDARTVLLGGTASRYNTLTTHDWFDLKPGVTELKFRGTTAGAPQLTATWRSAWL
jgi:Siphovirus-type tail component, C-terminal domain